MSSSFIKVVDPDLQFVVAYSKVVAKKYWSSFPDEEKHRYTKEDLTQDLILHFLEKKDKFTSGRDFKKWVRTIIYNKAITISNSVWDQKHLEKYCDFSDLDYLLGSGVVTKKVSSEGVPEIILVTERTPISTLITIEQGAIQMAKKTKITVDEVRELCERFEITFDEADVQQSLIDCLSHALEAMSDEDFEALPDELQAKLSELGDAVSNNAISIVSKKSTAKKPKKSDAKQTGDASGPGRGRRNPDGPVAKIREAFDEGKGIVRVADMIVHIHDLGVVCSEATIRTQMGKLRKAYGLVSEGAGRGTRGSGIVSKIKELFESGIQEISEMVKSLEALGLEFSPATVRTQMGKLRREAGITGSARRKAEEKTPITEDTLNGNFATPDEDSEPDEAATDQAPEEVSM